MNIPDPKDALRNIEIFGGLDDDACSAIAQMIRWRNYGKGVEVVTFKDTSQDVYFIASGRLRATIFSYSGKEISYEELDAGDMFGELSAIVGEPRATNVIVLSASRIGSMSGSDFWRVLHEYPDVADRVLKRVAKLVRHLCERVYKYCVLDVKDRVRSEILRLANESEQHGNKVVIRNMPTHVEIAHRINTRREAVTRELNELKKKGLISQDKRVLIINDIDALADLLSEDI